MSHLRGWAALAVAVRQLAVPACRHGGGGLYYGQGWLLDVTIHPDYEENGWIYLHHTDRCFECSARSREHKRSASMNRMIRGRIVDGHWVDEELIWEAVGTKTVDDNPRSPEDNINSAVAKIMEKYPVQPK